MAARSRPPAPSLMDDVVLAVPEVNAARAPDSIQCPKRTGEEFRRSKDRSRTSRIRLPRAVRGGTPQADG